MLAVGNEVYRLRTSRTLWFDLSSVCAHLLSGTNGYKHGSINVDDDLSSVCAHLLSGTNGYKHGSINVDDDFALEMH